MVGNNTDIWFEASIHTHTHMYIHVKLLHTHMYTHLDKYSKVTRKKKTFRIRAKRCNVISKKLINNLLLSLKQKYQYNFMIYFSLFIKKNFFLKRPNNNDNLVPMSNPTVQMLISKHHFPLKGTTAPCRNMTDPKSRAGNII